MSTKTETVIAEYVAKGWTAPNAETEALMAEAEAAGAGLPVLRKIREADIVSRESSITLPAGRYAHLSRAKGWCRKGQGKSAVWGERAAGGAWTVSEPGLWIACSSDGFKREERVEWTVSVVTVGDQTLMLAAK